MDKTRNHGLDISRILACMAVVLCHTIMLFWDFDPSSAVWAVYNFLAIAARFCVPMFFFISGALMLSREKLDVKKQLKRAGHFLALYFIWSFVCAAFDNSFLHVWYQDASLSQLIFGSYYHLWYLPAMVLCYLFLPMLHAFIYRDFSKPGYAGGLFALLVLLTLLSWLSHKPEWLGLLLEHFDLMYLKYLLCMFFGFWLYRHPLSNKQLVLLGLAALAATVLYASLNRSYSVSIAQASARYYDQFGLPMQLITAFIFALSLRIEKLPEKLCPIVKELSACTFGIYLLHPLFISALKSLGLDFTQFDTFVFFPLCYLAFLLLPLLASMVLRRIPIIKKLFA